MQSYFHKRPIPSTKKSNICPWFFNIYQILNFVCKIKSNTAPRIFDLVSLLLFFLHIILNCVVECDVIDIIFYTNSFCRNILINNNNDNDDNNNNNNNNNRNNNISWREKNRGYLISETRRSKLFCKYYSSLQNSQNFIPSKFNHINVTLIKRVTTKNWPELKLSKKQQLFPRNF